MSDFIEVTPLGANQPMLLNLSTVRFIGRSEGGESYVVYTNKDFGYQNLKDKYEDVKQRIFWGGKI